MSHPAPISVSLPFVWRGRRLFAVPLRLAVCEAQLPAVLDGAARQLSEQAMPAGIDGLLLRDVVDEGWRTHAVHDDRIAYVLSRDVWLYLTCAGSYERFLEGRFSVKTRESFARDEARFVDEFGVGGGLDLRAYRGPAQLAEFRRQVAALGAAGNGPESVPGDAADAARAFVLFARGEAVAWVCLLAVGEVLHYAGSGEREDFRQWSAGSIVQRHAFGCLFADPAFRYVDFRPGESELKRQFANGAVRSAVVLHLRRSLRNRVLLAAHAFLQRRGAGAGGAPEASDGLRAPFAARG